MEIVIRGHWNASEILKHAPDLFHVVLISSGPEAWTTPEAKAVARHAKGLLRLEFEDIDSPRQNLIAPTREHVQAALDWATPDRLPLLVSCHAGISRSAATAYVLACARTDPRTALAVLDRNRHLPNELIVRHGADILGCPEMVEIIRVWKQQHTLLPP